MGTKRHIVVVEDEPDLAHLVAFNLERSGYEVRIAPDGLDAINLVQKNPPDLVILDLMIPGLGGLDVARRLRVSPKTARVPILMLTAKAQESDQVAGLAAGADDYITKPFSIKILLARVEAILRRTAPAGAGDLLRIGPIEADLNLHQVTVNDDPITLTLTEFRILIALMRRVGKAMTREDLMYSAIGPDIMVTARTIDVHIAAIRKKLGDAGPLIQTVRGVGYLLKEGGAAGETEQPRPAANEGAS